MPGAIKGSFGAAAANPCAALLQQRAVFGQARRVAQVLLPGCSACRCGTRRHLLVICSLSLSETGHSPYTLRLVDLTS